jgi:4-hydroxy-4-methyl-2-oxoglutarate aldolase
MIAGDEIGVSVLATAGGARVRVAVGLSSVAPGTRLLAPAFTVQGVSGDNLALHRAVEAAPPAAAIVAHLDGDGPGGHWGELITLRAQARGIAGLVLDGTVRDVAEIAALGFPAFVRGVWPAPARKVLAGRLGVPVTVAGVRVETGDLVAADDDGLVVVPASAVGEVLDDARALASREVDLARRVRGGERLCDALGLVLPEHDEATR